MLIWIHLSLAIVRSHADSEGDLTNAEDPGRRNTAGERSCFSNTQKKSLDFEKKGG